MLAKENSEKNVFKLENEFVISNNNLILCDLEGPLTIIIAPPLQKICNLKFYQCLIFYERPTLKPKISFTLG